MFSILIKRISSMVLHVFYLEFQHFQHSKTHNRLHKFNWMWTNKNDNLFKNCNQHKIFVSNMFLFFLKQSIRFWSNDLSSNFKNSKFKFQLLSNCFGLLWWRTKQHRTIEIKRKTYILVTFEMWCQDTFTPSKILMRSCHYFFLPLNIVFVYG